MKSPHDGCGCRVGECPASGHPDGDCSNGFGPSQPASRQEFPFRSQPPDKALCAICSTTLNRARTVHFFERGGPPPPPPPPPLFDFIWNVAKSVSELSTSFKILNATGQPDGSYERKLPVPLSKLPVPCPLGAPPSACKPEEPQVLIDLTGDTGLFTASLPSDDAWDKLPELKKYMTTVPPECQPDPNSPKPACQWTNDVFDLLFFHVLPGNLTVPGGLPKGETRTLQGNDITVIPGGATTSFLRGGL